MYTQCPECLSIYEISQEQLQQSRGNVQCGVCDTRFRAQVRLAASLKSPLFERPKPKSSATTTSKPSPERENASAPQPAPAKTPPPAKKPASHQTAQSAASTEAKPQYRAVPQRPAASGSGAQPAKPSARPAAPTPTQPHTRPSQSNDPGGHQPELTDWALATIDSEAGMEPMIRRQGGAEERHNEAMPAMLDRSGAASKAWSLLITTLVGLAALLAVAQSGWLLRQHLAELPVLGAFVKPWCGSACQGAAQDIGNWQIADRRIHAHPRVEGVILVDVTIRNVGQSATAYPALRVRLLDDNQQLVAERTLLPDAYMRELRPGDRLSAGALLPLSVAIEAPRHRWSHYELELLASVVL